MKYYIIAGEASGDLHAGNLMKAMRAKDASVEFRFWGGDHMTEVSGTPVKHIKELAFMGFIEVVANLRTILGNIKFCKNDILAYKPDAIILVDYPGFNLRIAEWAKAQGIKVFYYISPQVWAWKQKRVHKIKKVVDQMFVILPFEKAFYAKFGMEVEFVGHPLLDAIDNYQAQLENVDLRQKHQLDERPIIALLPGSRIQEVKKKLPIMLNSIVDREKYQLIIAGAPSLEVDFYNQFTAGQSNIRIIHGATYDILSLATAALVTSGTATLETALFKVPQVVCYKGSPISYAIAKQLVKIDFISLVNLILDREAVKELIQSECNEQNIQHELELILPEGKKRAKMLADYDKLIEILGKGGASDRVADKIVAGCRLQVTR
jgi:lipid-A-disaccharide synthase